MDQIVVTWYGWLAGLTQGVVFWLESWSDRIQLPVVTAMLFGLIGATSPCQLTTNVGALAYAAARPGGARPFVVTLGFVAGKVSAYAAIGALIILTGLELQSRAIPVIVVARKALGPLMIAVGLGLLGAWRLRVGLGLGLAARISRRLKASNSRWRHREYRLLR